MELLVVLLLVLLPVAFAGGVAVGRRRAGPPELEPAPAPSAAVEAPAGVAVPAPEAEAPAAVGAEAGPAAVAEAEVAPALAAEPEAAAAVPGEPEPAPPVAEPEPTRPRFRDRLGKARSLLSGYVGALLARTALDDDVWDELEEALVRADLGAARASTLLDDLRGQVKSNGITTPDALLDALKADLKGQLGRTDRELRFEPGAPNVWLFVGVNGVGKTTTIGKVGLAQAGEGRKVVMAAGDTFRAAAGEQLEAWAQRAGADVVRGADGADPGAVVFDAVQRAAARGVDLVLADTAGRLHTKVNLMEELKKVRRVAEREPGKVTEVLLVIDATTGQNGLVQARQFAEAVDVTGIVLTKLDGTAKGGIAFAIQTELGLPIKLVGLGEGAADLVPFDPDEFVEALFS